MRAWLYDRLPSLGLFVVVYIVLVGAFAVVGQYRFAGLAGPATLLLCIVFGDRAMAWLARPATPHPVEPDQRVPASEVDRVRLAVTAALCEMPVADLLLSGKVAEVASTAARQACAQEILDHADRHLPLDGNNAQKRMRRHLRIAASIVNPQPAPVASPAELKESA